jgi:hypothetical protein
MSFWVCSTSPAHNGLLFKPISWGDRVLRSTIWVYVAAGMFEDPWLLDKLNYDISIVALTAHLASIIHIHIHYLSYKSPRNFLDIQWQAIGDWGELMIYWNVDTLTTSSSSWTEVLNNRTHCNFKYEQTYQCDPGFSTQKLQVAHMYVILQLVFKNISDSELTP